jgi:hypothetical protein
MGIMCYNLLCVEAKERAAATCLPGAALGVRDGGAALEGMCCDKCTRAPCSVGYSSRGGRSQTGRSPVAAQALRVGRDLVLHLGRGLGRARQLAASTRA